MRTTLRFPLSLLLAFSLTSCDCSRHPFRAAKEAGFTLVSEREYAEWQGEKLITSTPMCGDEAYFIKK